MKEVAKVIGVLSWDSKGKNVTKSAIKVVTASFSAPLTLRYQLTLLYIRYSVIPISQASVSIPQNHFNP
jgi:hypothetical protein